MSTNFSIFLAHIVGATDMNQATQSALRPILQQSLKEGGYMSGKPNFEAFWASLKKQGADMGDDVMPIMREAIKAGGYDKPVITTPKPTVSLKAPASSDSEQEPVTEPLATATKAKRALTTWQYYSQKRNKELEKEDGITDHTVRGKIYKEEYAEIKASPEKLAALKAEAALKAPAVVPEGTQSATKATKEKKPWNGHQLFVHERNKELKEEGMADHGERSKIYYAEWRAFTPAQQAEWKAKAAARAQSLPTPTTPAKEAKEKVAKPKTNYQHFSHTRNEELKMAGVTEHEKRTATYGAEWKAMTEGGKKAWKQAAIDAFMANQAMPVA